MENEIVLRPYQQECVDVLDKTDKGRHLVALATGLGKCLGKGTPVLMHDGRILPVEKIREGDFIMGPDGNPRQVCGLAHGCAMMYQITQKNGMTYTANGPHILSVKIAGADGQIHLPDGRTIQNGDICNISIEEYLKSPDLFRRCAKGWYAGVDFPRQQTDELPYRLGVTKSMGGKIPDRYLKNSRDVRLSLLAGLLDGYEAMGGQAYREGDSFYRFETDDAELSHQILLLARSLGLGAREEKGKERAFAVFLSGETSKIPGKNINRMDFPDEGAGLTDICVKPIGNGEYFGFELIGPDRLFLLGDYSVTHNTVVFSSLKRTGRTLILSHRDELVRQPEKYYEGKCSYGIEKADETSDGEEVVSASVQSLSMDKRLQKFKPDDFDTIIVDEAHHAAAPTYKKVLRYFSGARRVFGFTATPKRGDDVRLDDIFDDIIYKHDLKWGIENNFLCNISCKVVNGHFTLNGIKKTAGDYNQLELDRTVGSQETAALVAKVYVENCHEAGRHTIVYCVSKKTCTLVMTSIRKLVPDEKETIQMVTGETPADERRQLLEDFSAGTVKCLVNCMVLTEGTDLPICDAIVNLRPTCNPSLYMQIVGRGTRLYEGKKNCLVVDVVPEDGKARNLCMAPQLFGVDYMLLDKRTKKLVGETEDLLELCNLICGNIKDISEKLEYEIESVNRFIEESEEALFNSGNIQNYLNQYAPWTKQGEEVSAHGLFLREGATDEKAYAVYPNYSERIYFSKPDLLGKTTVRFEVQMPPGTGLRGNCFIGNLPWDEAIQLAYYYCLMMPSQYRYCWNEKEANKWKDTACTENQARRVTNNLMKYGMDTGDMGSVNKLDASLLIDHIAQLRSEKAFLREYGYTKGSSTATKAKRQAVFEEKENSLRKQESLGRASFDAFRKYVTAAGKRIDDANALAEQERRKQLQNSTIKVKIKLFGGKNIPMSPKQLSYIKSLTANAKRNGYILPDDTLFESKDKIQASCLISILKEAADSPCSEDGMKRIANLAEVFEEAEENGYGTFEAVVRLEPVAAT